MIWAVDKTASVHTVIPLKEGGSLFVRMMRIFSLSDYDDSRWQLVTVPHDWAVYGAGVQNDRQKVAIKLTRWTKEAMEHAGRTGGGYTFVGVGWYRLDFEVPAFAKGKKATLVFDGAMSHAVFM